MQLVVIGADSEKVNRFLSTDDPCYGRHFSKSAPECKECTAPVVADGHLCLMRDMCAALSAGGDTPALIKELSGVEIQQRLAAGTTVPQMFVEVLNGGDASLVGAKARDLLCRRLRYLTSKGMPAPRVPTLKELTVYVQNHERDSD